MGQERLAQARDQTESLVSPDQYGAGWLRPLDMRIATWNVNHRVGKTRFRPLAPRAALAINADVLVFTEYFPQANHTSFCEELRVGGLACQLATEMGREKANRVLIAANLRMESLAVSTPVFDAQFPANQLVFLLPASGIRIIGVRIPVYTSENRGNLGKCWEWLEQTAASLRYYPAVIAGDLNVSPTSRRGVASQVFGRLLSTGWRRAAPSEGISYFGLTGARSELDHILVTEYISATEARYVPRSGDHVFAGEAGALSDHAPLMANIEVTTP